MRCLLTLLLFSSISFLAAQYTPAKVNYTKVTPEYDKVGDLKRKNFYRKDDLVLTIHYPSEGSIGGMCNGSNLVYDSVYVYTGKLLREVKFSRSGKKQIYEATWESATTTVVERAYRRKDGELLAEKRFRAALNFSSDNPLCNSKEGIYHNYIGESFRSDDEGKEQSYRNYDTGEGRRNGVELVGPGKEMIAKYRPAADDVVRQSYGDSFFSERIAFNYGGTVIYSDRAMKRPEKNGQPRITYDGNSFSAADKKPRYIDYNYVINLPGRGVQSLITVRVDSLGRVATVDPGDWSFRSNVTRGLLNPGTTTDKYLTVREALDVLKKSGIDTEGAKVGVTHIRGPKGTGDSREAQRKFKRSQTGQLYYSVYLRPYRIPSLTASVTLYDQWLVDPFSGEITAANEKMFGSFMVINYRVSDQSGKKGIRSEFGDEIVPFVYDDLNLPESSTRLIAKQDGKYGLITIRNKTVLPFEYDGISVVNFKKQRWQGQFFVVQKDGLRGLVNYKGQSLLPVAFKSVVRKDDETIEATNADGTKQLLTLSPAD